MPVWIEDFAKCHALAKARAGLMHVAAPRDSVWIDQYAGMMHDSGIARTKFEAPHVSGSVDRNC